MRSGVELAPSCRSSTLAPALLTRMSSRPNSLRDRPRAMRFAAVRLAHVAGRDQRLAAAFAIRSATACSGSRRRPVSATAAPSRASASAAASPMPLPAPVTQATFPARPGTAAYSTWPVALSIRCMWSRCAAIFRRSRPCAPAFGSVRAAHLRAVDREEHHRLVAHRLDHLDAGVECREVLRAVGLGLGQVLRAGCRRSAPCRHAPR